MVADAVQRNRSPNADRRCARQPLLLDQKLKGAIAPSASRDLEHASLVSIAVENRPHGETLEERAARDVLREFLDRDARLDAADIGLAQHQLVEGNITGLAQRDLLNRFCH